MHSQAHHDHQRYSHPHIQLHSQMVPHFPLDSISSSTLEAAWEQSQASHHVRVSANSINVNAEHDVETSGASAFRFGYSSANTNSGFPQYNVSPISPISPPLSASSVSPNSPANSSDSSSSLASPTAASLLPSAGDVPLILPVRNLKSLCVRPDIAGSVLSASGSNNLPSCLPTHQLFDFEVHNVLAHHHLPPSPTASTASAASFASLASPSQSTQTSSMFPSDLPASTISPSASGITGASSGKRTTSSGPSSTSSATSTVKKVRACISTKDFVPPDVTGLSKREARLVKNRAAAFLSRQRKREEFELMEIRVAELEQENARLKALAEGRTPPPPSTSLRGDSSQPSSEEVETLKAQLSAARQRENDLVERLERIKYQAQQRAHQQTVKTETSEPTLSEASSSGSSTPLLSPQSSFPCNVKTMISNPRSGASLGLMVLLCALPSLLATPSTSSSTLPTSSSFLDNTILSSWDPSAILPSASTDIPRSSSDLGWEFDWEGRMRSVKSSIDEDEKTMDVDDDDKLCDKDSADASTWRRLEFEGAEDSLGLSNLDISFATCKGKDGRICIRIHPSAKPTPALDPHSEPLLSESSMQLPFSLPFSSSSSTTDLSFTSMPLPFHGNTFGASLSMADSDPLGPFLGSDSSSLISPVILQEFPFNSDFASIEGRPMSTAKAESANEGARRHVRISLKTMPRPGGEGGEWEVTVR